MKGSGVALIIITILLFVTGAASADQTSCNVSTRSVNFGSYDVLERRPLDAEGMIKVFCRTEGHHDGRRHEKKGHHEGDHKGVSVNIAIGPSQYSGGFSPRMMGGSPNEDMLKYNFYIDPARRKIWGDGSGNTITRTRKVGREPWKAKVYGRIEPRQNVSVGSYSDTVTVIITW